MKLDIIDEYWVYKINGEIIVSIDEENLSSISQTYLFDNYPNPFNHSTTFCLKLSKEFTSGFLSIYNIKGQLIKELQIENYELGTNEIVWDGKDINGKRVQNGIYFLKLESDNFISVKKLIKIR